MTAKKLMPKLGEVWETERGGAVNITTIYEDDLRCHGYNKNGGGVWSLPSGKPWLGGGGTEKEFGCLTREAAEAHLGIKPWHLRLRQSRWFQILFGEYPQHWGAWLMGIAALVLLMMFGCSPLAPCAPRPLVLTDSTGVGSGEDGGAVVDSGGWCAEGVR